MDRHTKIVAAAGVGAIVLALGLGAALAARPVRTAWWTDGASVREREASAPMRRVLWSPSRPLKVMEAVGDAGSSDAGVDEYEAKVSFDGSTMVFVRRRPGTNADLFTAHRTPSGWGEATPIDAVNTEHDELGPELSRDGTALYFYSDRPGGIGGYDLWVSHRTDAAWGTPVNLGSAVNTAWNEYGPAITPDGATLYFASNRAHEAGATLPTDAWSATIREQRGRRDYDLYSSAIRGGETTTAAPLATLNTPNDEGAPAISPGGDFLYFASDRAGGCGGFDVWRSRILRGTLGTPENLGAAVNSSSNEMDPGLSADGFRLCFSTDRARPDAGAPVATSAPMTARLPAKYALWESVSREVFSEEERGDSRLAAVWDSLWPWLLLLAVMGTLLFLLLRIVQSEAWRKRLGQLSLLARCVLVSLLIHALAASGLAVWRVGSGIINAVRREGGTRVILTSSGAASGVAGDAAAQLLAPAAGESTIVPRLDRVAASITAGPIEMQRVDAALPALIMPVMMPMNTAELTEAPGPSALIAERAAPQRDRGNGEEAVPRIEHPESPTDEAVARVPSAEGRAPVAAVVDGPIALRTETLPAPASQPTNDTQQLLRGIDVEAPGTPTVVDARTEGPKRSERESVEVALPRAGAASSVSQERPAPIADEPMKPGLSAPTSGGTLTTLRVDVPVSDSTLFKDVDRLSGTSEAARPAPVMPAPAPTGGVPLPRPSDIVFDANLPRIEPARASAASAERRKADGATPSMSVLRAGNSTAGASAPIHSTVIDAPAPISSGDGAAVMAVAEPSASLSHSSSDVVRASPGTGPARREEAFDGLRIPELPSGPVTPVETFAQRAPEVRGEVLEKMGGSAETERAVGLALEWFARHQQSDGHWSGRGFDDHCGHCGAAAEFDADAAMTGMALLCYLGAGHTHTVDGPYRDNVSRAIRWLVNRQGSNGDLRRGETMYGQTVATVALCEALAMTSDQELAGPARRAVAFVLAASARGSTSGADTAVLGWLVMTVESARRAGIDVPRDTFANAEKWLNYVGVPGSAGRYSYRKGEAPSVEMTAEAMFVRQLVGHARTEPNMQESARYVLNVAPKWTEGAPTLHWYYATLALFEHQGEAWKRWNDAIVPELIAHQRQDGAGAGSWDPQDRWSRMGGRIYQTAVCTLSLEVYYRYKPK